MSVVEEEVMERDGGYVLGSGDVRVEMVSGVGHGQENEILVVERRTCAFHGLVNAVEAEVRERDGEHHDLVNVVEVEGRERDV